MEWTRLLTLEREKRYKTISGFYFQEQSMVFSVTKQYGCRKEPLLLLPRSRYYELIVFFVDHCLTN